MSDGVPFVPKTSTSYVEHRQAFHRAEAACRALTRLMRDTRAGEPHEKLRVYVEELREYIKELRFEFGAQEEEKEEEEEEEEEKEEGRLDRHGALDSAMQSMHLQYGVQMSTLRPRNDRNKAPPFDWMNPGLQHVATFVTLGALPAEVVHEYLQEQRLIAGLPSSWQRFLFALVLQERKVPAISDRHLRGSSGRVAFRLAFCCCYCFFATGFVIAFYFYQNKQSEVDANKDVYAIVVLNTVVDLLAISPLLALLRFVLFPFVVKLILMNAMKESFAGMMQEEHTVTMSRETDATKGEIEADGWTAYIDDATGVRYFYHKQTRRTTWTKPGSSDDTDDDNNVGDSQEENKEQPTNDASKEIDLSYSARSQGWQQIEDAATGIFYYHNERLRRTTWTNPETENSPSENSPSDDANEDAGISESMPVEQQTQNPLHGGVLSKRFPTEDVL